MHSEQENVLEFMVKMEQVTEFNFEYTAGLPTPNVLNLRRKLILEEAKEFCEATTLENYAKELADLLYVVYGAANAAGIDMEPVFQEVHRSNMTKIGGPVREDGKRLKPVWYEPANLAPILAAQGAM